MPYFRRRIPEVLVTCAVMCMPGCTDQRTGQSLSEVRTEKPGAARRSAAGLAESVEAALSAAVDAQTYSTHRNTPWEIVHLALGLGEAAVLLDESALERRTISAIDYFRQGGPYVSDFIYARTGDRVRMKRSVHLGDIERHPNQFLAYFAQLEIPPDMEMHAGPETFQVSDMVNTAIKSYDPAAESTFTLMALAAYGPTDSPWVNEFGQTFDLESLVHAELTTDGGPLPCGGAHRMFALATALRRAQATSAPDSETWRRCRQSIGQEIVRVQSSQADDGSLSFSTPTDSNDRLTIDERKMHASGHTLEWLLVALDDSEFDEAWLQHAVRFLCASVHDAASHPPNPSTWFHAVHALRMYQNRTGGQGRSPERP